MTQNVTVPPIITLNFEKIKYFFKFLAILFCIKAKAVQIIPIIWGDAVQKISKKYLILWRIRLSVVAAAVSAAASLLPPKFAFCALAVTAATFCFFFFFYFPRKYKNTVFFLEDGLLCIESGVIYKVKRYIAPENVQYINFIATPLQRLMGIYTAEILASGATGKLSSLDKEGRKALLRFIRREYEL